MKRSTLFLSLCLMLIGCVSARITPSQNTQNTLDAPDALALQREASFAWLKSCKTYKLYHRGLLELGGRSIPMQGVMRLDAKKHEVRLAVFGDLGITLFEAIIDANGTTLKKTSPALARISHFPDFLTQTINFLFLTPMENRECVQDIKNGADELRCSRGRISTTFSSFTPHENVSIPGKLVFENAKRRFRLTLWLINS
jgi:hypothetical protein